MERKIGRKEELTTKKGLKFLRPVFTSDGVGVGVVIRSAERFDLVKTTFQSRLRIRRLRSSEN